MTLAIAESKGTSQLRVCQSVQMRYGVPAREMAAVLCLKEEQYRNKLRKLGLTPDPSAFEFDLRRDATEIVVKIQSELGRLAREDGLPDKGAADALTALARTVKTVGELLKESEGIDSRAVPKGEATDGLDMNRMRTALQRVERRIEELAQKRANEILDRRSESQTDCEVERGVAVPGA